MNEYPESDMKKAEKYCLRLLALRSRSEHEINKKLEDRGYSQDSRTSLIIKLKEKRLIDDESFAEEWISSRLMFKPRSRALLQKELIDKGINEDIIKKVLEKADDRVLSVKILEDHLSIVSGLSEEKKKIRLFRILASRGFDADTAREAVESVLNC